VCSRTRRVHTTGTPAVSFVMYRRRTAVVRGVYFDERGRKVRRRLRAALFFSAAFSGRLLARVPSERASVEDKSAPLPRTAITGPGGRESSPGKKLREERERKGTRKGRGGKAGQILQAHHRPSHLLIRQPPRTRAILLPSAAIDVEPLSTFVKRVRSNPLAGLVFPSRGHVARLSV